MLGDIDIISYKNINLSINSYRDIYTMNILHIMVDIKQEGDVGERKRGKYIYTKLCLCAYNR